MSDDQKQWDTSPVLRQAQEHLRLTALALLAEAPHCNRRGHIEPLGEYRALIQCRDECAITGGTEVINSLVEENEQSSF